MSRLFTFGCSFTSYHWPTWADILGREYDYFENWGRSGGSNQFIFNSLIEAKRLNNALTQQEIYQKVIKNIIQYFLLKHY